MIRHMVFWEFADEYSLEENLDNAYRARRMLEGLPSVVKEIKSLTVLVNNNPSPGEPAVVLTSLFENQEDLDAYLVDSFHQETSDYIKPFFKNKRVHDFAEAPRL
ncbi:MAG: Dabb family protein [Oscillospiraceae bacterium]